MNTTDATSEADVIRRAVAAYSYLKKAQKAGKNAKIAITEDDKVTKEILLPSVMPKPEMVSADDVLRASGAERPVKEGTFLQRTGLVLATSVGALASLVTLGLILAWIISAPGVPAIPGDMDPEKAKAIIENYKQLQQTL